VKDVKNRSPREFKGFLPKHETLLWKNLSLDEVNKLTAYTCGKNTGSYYAESSHMKGSGRRKTFQFQYIDGVDKKCVGIELLQRDKDIVGRAVFARYTRGNVKIDFEKDKCKDYPLAASADGGGYGLRDLCVVFDAEVESNVRTDDVKNATVLPSKTQNAGKAWQENGNVATLTLPNGEKLEFVKCPAGTVDYRVGCCGWAKYDVPCSKVVKITRPYWIMMRPLARRNFKSYPASNAFQGGTNKKPDDPYDYPEANQSTVESFAESLSVELKEELPNGYVIRLPSFAEWDYAMRANSRDPKDPYADFDNDRNGNNKKVFEGCGNGTTPKNKWGIHEVSRERLLDRVDESNAIIERDKDKKHKAKVFALKFTPEMATDPLMWTDGDKYIPLIRRHVWFDCLEANRNWGHIRLVVGPDLVSEWRAKHGKK